MRAAEGGDLDEVKRIVFSVPGSGLACQRSALLSLRDNDGQTAAELARSAGHNDVVRLIESERLRMDLFE